MKIIAIVLDSVGLGALPDATEFGDQGAHTLDHTLMHAGVQLPNMAALGLGNIEGVHSVPPSPAPLGGFGRMIERNKGKDTSTGHWEFVGIHLQHPFKTFAAGFPESMLQAWCQRIGKDGWLLNKPCSGTQAIADYGTQHLHTGYPIVYTSVDSVFQVAAHTDVASPETLYHWCQEARALLVGDLACARVIARPFEGPAGAFSRLDHLRHDYALTPPHHLLDDIKAAGYQVVGIGKIPDIYAHRGFTLEVPSGNNLEGINHLMHWAQSNISGLVLANLVDFDSKYGHRRNPIGYAQALQQFDQALPGIMSQLQPQDYLMIISDHGNDPTWTGTDHTREYGMLLVAGPQLQGVNLGTRASFADVAQLWRQWLRLDQSP